MPGIDIRNFHDEHEANAWGEEWSREWFDHKMAIIEKAAILDFLKQYIEINQYLKGYNGQLLQEKLPNMSDADWALAQQYNHVVEYVDRAIVKSRLPETVYLYRETNEQHFVQDLFAPLLNHQGNLNLDVVAQLKAKFQHEIVREHRFLCAYIFKPSMTNDSILLKIKVPKSTHSGYIEKRLWPWAHHEFKHAPLIVVSRNQWLRYDHFTIATRLNGSQFLEITATIVDNN